MQRQAGGDAGADSGARGGCAAAARSRRAGPPRAFLSAARAPQVARYLPGQFYLPHFDAFDVTTGPGRECVATGGQRVATVLIYLNTLPPGVGGETRFPRLGGGDDAAASSSPSSSAAASRGGVAFRPEQGSALVFFPCTLDAQLDPLALHAAEPITAANEIKCVAQIWIRQGVFCAPPPAPPPAASAPAPMDDF